MSLFSRDGMLTGTEIERRVKKGHIQISPYDPKCVNPNSYNLKLHPQLLIYKRDAERANITPHVARTFENTSINNCDMEQHREGEIGTATADASNISYLDEPARNHDNKEDTAEPNSTTEETDVKHTMASGSEDPVIEENPEDNTSKPYYGVQIITGNAIKMAISDRVDSAVESLNETIDRKIDGLETKWSGAFNQLGGTVEYNDRKSRERDEEIKSLPIIESNYLPPLDMHKKNETIEFQIPEEGYVLQPGVLYIGRTVERTATDRFIPMINGRSSGGRLGISIHICAGFGDIGFDGTWTLEITVVEPVRIYPNEEIAQVCFFTPAGKKAKLYRGRYYKQEDATASRFHQPKKEY